MKTLYLLFWVISLIFWAFFACNSMFLEMWVSVAFLWIFNLKSKQKHYEKHTNNNTTNDKHYSSSSGLPRG